MAVTEPAPAAILYVSGVQVGRNAGRGRRRGMEAPELKRTVVPGLITGPADRIAGWPIGGGTTRSLTVQPAHALAPLVAGRTAEASGAGNDDFAGEVEGLRGPGRPRDAPAAELAARAAPITSTITASTSTNAGTDTNRGTDTNSGTATNAGTATATNAGTATNTGTNTSTSTSTGTGTA